LGFCPVFGFELATSNKGNGRAGPRPCIIDRTTTTAQGTGGYDPR
jgi:hypothetical protein